MSAVIAEPADGLVLRPLRGVRFDPAQVSDLAAVTSPPYDVIEPDGVRLLETLDPHNIVRLILPREESGGTEGRYQHAAALLDHWIADGVLRVDPAPALYVYEQVTPTTVQRGLVGSLALRDPAAGVILPHEDVIPGPVSDRLELMRATQANLDPILLVYEGDGLASSIAEEICATRPIFTALTPDGVAHRLWAIIDERLVSSIRADLLPRRALIADGHHRYEAYRRLQAEQHAAGRGHGPWDFGLAMLVDSARHPLEIRAIHRVLPKLHIEDALAALRGNAQVTEVRRGSWSDAGVSADRDRRGPVFDLAGDPAKPLVSDEPADDADPNAGAAPAGGVRREGRFRLVADGREWLIGDVSPSLVAKAMPAGRAAAWKQLDAAILHHVLIDQVWREPDDPEHVTYHHDAAEAIKAAEHTGGVAVLLQPPDTTTVLGLAAAGQRVPRKTTSFGPKPRTGLLLRTFAS